jgi:hypothetical protein
MLRKAQSVVITQYFNLSQVNRYSAVDKDSGDDGRTQRFINIAPVFNRLFQTLSYPGSPVHLIIQSPQPTTITANTWDKDGRGFKAP